MGQTLVKLEGQHDDLDVLVTLSEGSWQVFMEGDSYYLTSDTWDAHDDLSDVHERASEVIAILNGAAGAYVNNWEPVRLSGIVTRRKRDGSNAVSIAAITARARIRHAPDPIAGIPKIDAWINLAGKDANAQKALALYGSLEHNWRNLYLVLEVIADSCGGVDNMPASRWCTDPKGLKLFKQTANNWKELGADSRHSTEKCEKPKYPMSLREAQAVIRSALLAWLQSL